MRACGPQQTISKMQQRRSTEGPRSWKITATVTQFCRGLDHVCLSDPHVFWAPWARIQSIHRQRGHHWTPYDTCQCWRFAQLCSVHSVRSAQVLQVASCCCQTFVTVHRKQLENDWRNNSPYLLLVQHGTCKTDWSTSDCHSSYILVVH